jgi:hypothetical protein
VILLENFNKWNLSLAKEGSSKEREREEQGLKRKRGETSVEKLHVLKKKRGWNLQAAVRDSIKRKKERIS